MVFVAALLLVLNVSLLTGFYMREIRERLKGIKFRVVALKAAQENTEGPKATFVGPMTRAELTALDEEEKIRMLNE